MDNVKMEAEQSVIKFISWESATLDYMENKGFNVKTYKDAIGGLRAQVFSSIIGWDKYSGKLKSKLLMMEKVVVQMDVILLSKIKKAFFN